MGQISIGGRQGAERVVFLAADPVEAQKGALRLAREKLNVR